jgi:5-methylcytosine-specific restriction protein A
MPRKSPKPCRHPGCPALVYDGERFCEEHRKQRQKEHDARRGSAASRGYGHRWRKLRKMFLRSHPLCADPFGVHAERGELVAATEVDHIVSRARGGTDAWDNLQALCKPCHSRKTAQEDRRWG